MTATVALPPYVDTGAIIDDPYRYLLWRRWSDEPAAVVPDVTWVMLNPSTADGDHDDATIGKCRRFAVAWGFGGMHVVNLFAYRATDPAALRAVPEAGAVIGVHNGNYLDGATVGAVTYTGIPPTGRVVVAGWGAHGLLYNRGRAFLQWMTHAGRPVHHLVRNLDGTPRHPLYVPAATVPTPTPTGRPCP